MSPDPLWCIHAPARPCRTPQSHGATWAVEHVAPQGPGSTDALSGRATRIVPHVARGERVKRHGGRHMSHGTRGSGDMDAPPCRPSRARRATCKDSDVALRADPERHAKARMSHFATIRSDMQGLACRTSRRSGATCALGNVAPHMGEVRDRSACRIARRVEPSDIHRLASRTTRAGRATCRGTVGDKHERECRSWLASYGISWEKRADGHACGLRRSPDSP
jgi:hypothetical protein